MQGEIFEEMIENLIIQAQEAKIKKFKNELSGNA